VRSLTVCSTFCRDHRRCDRNRVAGNLISEDDQRRKLETIVEAARGVWG
jgi:hypothetical protein